MAAMMPLIHHSVDRNGREHRGDALPDLGGLTVSKYGPFVSAEVREQMEVRFQKEYDRTCCELIDLLDRAENIGENSMGMLHRSHAARYHTITRKLRHLINELTQDACFEGEPIPREG